MRRLLEPCCLAVVLASLGCEARPEPNAGEPHPEATRREPAPRPTPAAPAAPAPSPAKPDTPKFDVELGQRFASAVAGLGVSDAAPPDASLRWRAPECSLEYEFRVSVGNDPSGKTDDALVMSGAWTARGESPGMILKNEEIRYVQMLAGTPRPAEGTPAAGLAEVRLRTDGRAWIEVDGPTALWSAFGTWVGVSKFHPTLPATSAPNSEGEWTFDVYPRSAAGAVEGTRGSLEVPEGMVLPKVAPTQIGARVTLERWIDVDGTRAAVLRAWSEQHDERSQAQVVVLATGTLLHAELREHSELHFGSAPENVQHVVIEGEARLVRACDGPTLPRFQ